MVPSKFDSSILVTPLVFEREAKSITFVQKLKKKKDYLSGFEIEQQEDH
jgi:hypothetical protein